MVATKIAVTALLAVLIAGLGLMALPATGNASTYESPDVQRVTILAVPGPVSPEELARIPDAAIGLMSPGLGDVPAEQTWLDVGQGARAFDTKYDTPLNALFPAPGLVSGWPAALRRAASTGVSVEPGLLSTTLRRFGIVAASAQPPGDPDPSSLIAVSRGGWLRSAEGDCPGSDCVTPVTVSTASLSEAARIAAGRAASETVVVIESPPADSGDQLAIAIAGRGYSGMLRSASTRTPGYVLSTDLAPTILRQFSLPVPREMTGLRIGSGGEVDYRALGELEGRYQQVGKRKDTAILFPLLTWLLIAAAAALVRGRRYAPTSAATLCLAVVLLPATLLLTASLSPSAAVESAIAGLLPVAVALTMVRRLRGWDALALACAVTVTAFAIDLVAGLSLTPKAVIGPNPGLGARFYGIGNELESTLMVLTSIGTGAALQARGQSMDRRRAALAFLATGLAGTVVFASGRFGADVGAAIIFPLAAVTGAATVARRPRLIWLGGLAALAGVVLLAVADTLTGGETHFARSVLDGGASESTLEVLGHRLESTWESFATVSRLPVTLLALGLIVLAWLRRDWLRSMLSGREALRAGLVAAAVGSLAGALTNDSGALFLHVGTLYITLAFGFIWAVDSTVTEA
jgi:hypothetical protein